jgi:hypothetical protein
LNSISRAGNSGIPFREWSLDGRILEYLAVKFEFKDRILEYLLGKFEFTDRILGVLRG